MTKVSEIKTKVLTSKLVIIILLVRLVNTMLDPVSKETSHLVNELFKEYGSMIAHIGFISAVIGLGVMYIYKNRNTTIGMLPTWRFLIYFDLVNTAISLYIITVTQDIYLIATYFIIVGNILYPPIIEIYNTELAIYFNAYLDADDYKEYIKVFKYKERLGVVLGAILISVFTYTVSSDPYWSFYLATILSIMESLYSLKAYSDYINA